METINSLMSRVGCTKWPKRWESFYPEVEADFIANGTVYTDPQYYQNLHDKYGILNEYLSLYKEAAVEIGKNRDLALCLALLCRALQDRECHSKDMGAFSAPKRVDGKIDFAYDMVTALAIASEADMCYSLLQELKLPREHVDYVMNLPEKGIDYFKYRNDGRPGYSLLGWYQLAIDCSLFRLGRLEIQINNGFIGRCQVFEGPDGKQIALAHDMNIHRSGRTLGSLYCEDKDGAFLSAVVETADSYVGYPFDDEGLVSNIAITLPKSDWKRILSRGDDVISLHIPAGGGLTDEAVDDAIAQAREFADTYFPDYKYKAFDCHSWLLDPQLIKLTGENTNIARFCRRFRPITHYSKGDAVYNFVFFKTDMNFKVEDLPENSRLEKALKQHFLSGKAIYETAGYFF